MISRHGQANPRLPLVLTQQHCISAVTSAAMRGTEWHSRIGANQRQSRYTHTVPPLPQPKPAGTREGVGGGRVFLGGPSGVLTQELGWLWVQPHDWILNPFPRLCSPDSGSVVSLDLCLLFSWRRSEESMGRLEPSPPPSKGTNVPMCQGGSSVPQAALDTVQA